MQLDNSRFIAAQNSKTSGPALHAIIPCLPGRKHGFSAQKAPLSLSKAYLAIEFRQLKEVIR
jgi:hypothetical protein